MLLLGAALLGYSLRSRPGDESFYVSALSLGAVWLAGTLLSGPLHLGKINWRGRNQRPVFTGIAIGVLLGLIFLAGGLVVREIPPIADRIKTFLPSPPEPSPMRLSPPQDLRVATSSS